MKVRPTGLRMVPLMALPMAVGRSRLVRALMSRMGARRPWPFARRYRSRSRWRWRSRRRPTPWRWPPPPRRGRWPRRPPWLGRVLLRGGGRGARAIRGRGRRDRRRGRRQSIRGRGEIGVRRRRLGRADQRPGRRGRGRGRRAVVGVGSIGRRKAAKATALPIPTIRKAMITAPTISGHEWFERGRGPSGGGATNGGGPVGGPGGGPGGGVAGGVAGGMYDGGRWRQIDDRRCRHDRRDRQRRRGRADLERRGQLLVDVGRIRHDGRAGRRSGQCSPRGRRSANRAPTRSARARLSPAPCSAPARSPARGRAGTGGSTGAAC